MKQMSCESEIRIQIALDVPARSKRFIIVPRADASRVVNELTNRTQVIPGVEIFSGRSSCFYFHPLREESLHCGTKCPFLAYSRAAPDVTLIGNFPMVHQIADTDPSTQSIIPE